MKSKFLEIFEPVGFFMAIVSMVAGIALPLLWWDSKISVVLTVAAISFIYGSVIFRIARNGVWIAIFLVLFLVAMNWIGGQESEATGSAGIRITWVMFGLAGVIIGGSLVQHFFPRKPKSKTVPIPPNGLQVRWQEGKRLPVENS
ncbi:MAG: hypothetical protein WBX27_09240, partial [Specibacter sp.]